MFEAIALTGGFWFFLFVVFVVVAGVVSSEMDSFFGGGATLIMLAAGLQVFFGVPVWSSLVANPLLAVAGIILYVAVGIGYGVYFRYAEFLNDNATNIKRKWLEFVKVYPTKSNVDFRNSEFYRDFKPSYNADRIVAWVLMWPWGVAWDLMHKPVKYVYNNMYSLTGKLLDHVSARITDRIINDDKK